MTSSSSQHPDQTGLLSKLRSVVNRGKAWLGTDLTTLFQDSLDSEILEELENRLLTADVGVEATTWLIGELDQAYATTKDDTTAAEILEGKVLELLTTVERPFVVDAARHPFVVLAVGVNGAGKTTTLGKLASVLSLSGKSVLLAAGDTFRAGAVEQVTQWGERSGSGIVAQSAGADPAAVIFDALESARARSVDVVLADTAGRLHTAAKLMDQLRKIKRVIGRIDPTAPHETLLVLDATQGQNVLAQAREFNEVLGVTGLVITKLDGTAKGGILLAIARELALPVRFLSTGEDVSDLQPFEARAFTQALFESSAS